MLRDNMKDDLYFTNYIVEQNRRIEKFTKFLNNMNDDEKVIQCNRYIANFYRDLILAKYSIGANKSELCRVFGEYMQKLSICKIASYSEMIDVISLIYLLDLHYNLEYVCDSDEFDDGLTLTLKNMLIGYPNINNNSLKYSKYYMPFYNFISGNMPLNDFEKYIENEWYHSSNEFYWYDAHLSEENLYTGYWCWLAAALLKATKKQSSVKYIPKDII